MRAAYGLEIKSQAQKDFIAQVTGRDAATIPKEGFRTCLFLTGRRSGKSRISAVIAAYEGLFAGHEKRLAPGEVGIIPVLAPSKAQGAIVWKYLCGIFQSSPLLQAEVVDIKESDKTLILRNKIEIKVMVSDWRLVRGFTVVCCIIDEVCFLMQSEELKIRNDADLIKALKPSLAATAKLIAISTKYSKRGWAYSTWLKQHGSNKGVSASFQESWTTLVVDADSRTMNPTLSQAIVDAAMAEDPAAAASEYLGSWREDIQEFCSRALVESLVAKGRRELLPKSGVHYWGFADLSGGRSDSGALSIGHREGRKVVMDFLREYKPPFNPYSVIAAMSEELKRFGLHGVTGDNYSAEFCASAFRSNGISFNKSDLPKSRLYLELLPRLCSAEIELLDDPTLVNQLSSLERRTKSGGQDAVDSPPNQHDDVANVAAGLAAARARKMVGGAWSVGQSERQLVGVY